MKDREKKSERNATVKKERKFSHPKSARDLNFNFISQKPKRFVQNENVS